MTAQQQAEQQAAEAQVGRGEDARPRKSRGDSWAARSQGFCQLVVDQRFAKRRHWAKEWVLDLCRADWNFMLHFADQSADYAHFLCLLRLGLADSHAQTESVAECARLIRTTKRKALLEELFPCCPAGIVNILPKLSVRPMPKEAYWRLIRAFEDKSLRKYLRHAKRLRKFDIEAVGMLDELPKKFHFGVMQRIEDMDDYYALASMIQAAQQLNLNITEKQFSDAARQAKNAHNMCCWIKGMVGKLPFPPPPWEGNDDIRPLRNRLELKEAAEYFSNCARRYAHKIALGYSYLYVCDRGPAMVEIAKDAFFGWVVEEVKGKKNSDLANSKTHAITREFNQAGIYLPLGGIHNW